MCSPPPPPVALFTLNLQICCSSSHLTNMILILNHHNQKDLDGAMIHLERLLRTQPRHYDALARLIQVRR